MDKTERETRDFMNVESFSQLPFIRPTPPPVKENGSSSSAIRLFGQEFGSPTIIDDQNNNTNKDIIKSDHNRRKFECHYCGRNFPTSQALGGHQNAHKRERQHAKRAHLGLSDPHDHYGLLSYSRLASAPALPTAYHSWNSSSSAYSAATNRLYSSHGSQPINGRPLAWWRIPNAHSTSPFTRERVSGPIHQQIPLFSSKDEPLSAISRGDNIGSQRGFGYESKASMQDHVSLDLHL